MDDLPLSLSVRLSPSLYFFDCVRISVFKHILPSWPNRTNYYRSTNDNLKFKNQEAMIVGKEDENNEHDGSVELDRFNFYLNFGCSRRRWKTSDMSQSKSSRRVLTATISPYSKDRNAFAKVIMMWQEGVTIASCETRYGCTTIHDFSRRDSRGSSCMILLLAYTSTDPACSRPCIGSGLDVK